MGRPSPCLRSPDSVLGVESDFRPALFSKGRGPSRSVRGAPTRQPRAMPARANAVLPRYSCAPAPE